MAAAHRPEIATAGCPPGTERRRHLHTMEWRRQVRSEMEFRHEREPLRAAKWSRARTGGAARKAKRKTGQELLRRIQDAAGESHVFTQYHLGAAPCHPAEFAEYQRRRRALAWAWACMSKPRMVTGRGTHGPGKKWSLGCYWDRAPSRLQRPHRRQLP